MSWQAYVDNQLLGTGKVSEAAILALDNTGVWAISKGYSAKFTPQEQADIRNAVKGHVSNDLTLVQTGGIRARATKFMFTRATERSLYGTKKTEDGSVIGIIVARTKQTIIVAEYAPPIQAGEATPIVESLADYLTSVGY